MVLRQAVDVVLHHEHIIVSCAGVQQGDPLGALYFCGIMTMVNDIQTVYNT